MTDLRVELATQGFNVSEFVEDEPNFVDGTLNYTCPAGKGTVDGDTEQSVMCDIDNRLPGIHTLQRFKLTGQFGVCSRT